MNRLLGAAVATALMCAVSAADDKAKADVKLSGTYTIVSGEEEGKAVPNDRLDGSVVVFTETTIMGTDKAKKEFFAATYTLDTGKTPWVINMTSTAPAKDKKDTDDKKAAEKLSTTGLIKVDGDTVTIIYALPGGKSPTEFKTGDKQQLFVMKKKATK